MLVSDKILVKEIEGHTYTKKHLIWSYRIEGKGLLFIYAFSSIASINSCRIL